MRPIIARHKVQVGDLGGKQGRVKRMGTRAADRSRRKTLHAVGIVRTEAGEIAFVNVPVERRQAINDGGIALQRDLFPQPIMKDRRNEFALVLGPGLLFDHGSQRQYLVQGEIHAGRLGLQVAPPHMVQGVHHGFDDVLRLRSTSKGIGFGKEIPFQRIGFNPEGYDIRAVANQL